MPPQPHIVLIMADQLRRDAIDCYGRLGCHTPNLSALAGESVVFDGAYCSTPLCIPTRVSLYTGKWPHSNGAIVNGGRYPEEQAHSFLGPEHRTLYEQLADAGYGINHVGLDHCHSRPTVRERVPGAVFDYDDSREDYLRQKGLETSLSKFLQPFRRPCPEYREGKMVVKDFPGPKAIMPYPLPAETFPDIWWAARAEEMIHKLNPDRPQFIEVLFTAPHPPMVAPEPWFSMYDPASIKLGPTVAKWCPGQPASLLRGFAGAMGAQLSRDEWPIVWAKHFGLTTMVDDCIGRVIRALKHKGLWGDSLVIFVQDHGEMLGCHALWEKHCCYEEAAHLPLLIEPPAAQAASGRRAQLTGHIDLAQTVCDYASAAPPPGAQGRSLRPVIQSAATPWRDAQFVEFNGNHGRGTPMRAVVADVDGRRWKYIHNHEDIDELYDLAADPLEERSLVEDPQRQALRGELRGKLSDWMRETGDYLTI